MTGSFDQLLSRYGQSVTLTPRASGDPISLRAFLQPVLRQQEALPFSPSPLGAVSTKQWLYLGSGRQPLSAGDAVDTPELSLIVQEARAMLWRDQVVYRWALLRQRKEAAE